MLLKNAQQADTAAHMDDWLELDRIAAAEVRTS